MFLRPGGEVQVCAGQQIAKGAGFADVTRVLVRRRHDGLRGAGGDGVVAPLEYQRRGIGLVELEYFAHQDDVVAAIVDMGRAALQPSGAAG
ncbi:hypothetical protein D3C85_1218670 [compost metagenome]